MTATDPGHRPAIVTRRYDAPTEAPYVFSTARAQTAARWGGRLVHFSTIIRHVDAILKTCVVVVATFEAESDILGYVAWGTDGCVEFLVLNKGLADDGRAPGAVRPPEGFRLRARHIAQDVVRALLADLAGRSLVMRRPSAPWVMDALRDAAIVPSIVPAGV